MIELLNIDCMDYMKTCEDKKFDLAVVDPPYVYEINKHSFVSTGKYNKLQPLRPKGSFKIGGNHSDAIGSPPTQEYFNELFRVSKNQIIFGGNFFCNMLPNRMCWLVWDKNNGDSKFSDCELIWTSFHSAVRKVKKSSLGQIRIHPTQKPQYVYDYILLNYAKSGMKILDTHLGGGNIAVACYERGFHLVACEIDKHYYDKASERIRELTRQHVIIF